MDRDSETAFLHKAHSEFTDSARRLDGRLVADLREARMHALAVAESRQIAGTAPTWLLPSGAMVAVLAAVVFGILSWNQSPQPAVPFAAGTNEDMSIVLGKDNLDMYADMDFYRWLQAQQQHQAGHDAGGRSRG